MRFWKRPFHSPILTKWICLSKRCKRINAFTKCTESRRFLKNNIIFLYYFYMEIIIIPPRGFGSNTYVLTQDKKTAVVIDPSQPRVQEELARRGLTAKYVLLTHCHFDHVGGVCALQNAGATVLCSEAEKPLIGTHVDLFEAFGAVIIKLRSKIIFGNIQWSTVYFNRKTMNRSCIRRSKFALTIYNDIFT